MGLPGNDKYLSLVSSIEKILKEGRQKAYSVVNNVIVKTYWEIGKQIVEYEQKGESRAGYGEKLLLLISRDLKLKFGNGFSLRNVYLMRQFFIKYPKLQTLSAELSWSHYCLLLSVEDDLARSFYEQETIQSKWSFRELKRQINSMLFERLALSQDKKGLMKLAKHGHLIKDEKDLVKDPYILEFLGLPESAQYTEKELEQRIIDKMQSFMLEFGKGFSFVKRQYRISLANKHYHIDLVFYNFRLNCFVLIDLKIGSVTHEDIGQMNMYLNYFKKEEQKEGDAEPIGIILAAEKDKLLVEYALGGLSNKLFVSRYQLYLPSKEELQKSLFGEK